MSSSYVSQDEIMLLVSMVEAEATFRQRIKDGKVPDDEKEALVRMFSAFNDYGKRISKRLDSRSKKRVVSRKKNYICELVPRTQQQCESHVNLPVDAWLDIVGYIIELKCKQCTGKKRCSLRNIFFEMRVPEACVVDPDNGIICEYQWGIGGNKLNYHSELLKEE